MNERVDDAELHIRPAQPRVGQDVLFRVGVFAGDEPDAERQERKCFFAHRVKQALRGEVLTEFFDFLEDVAESLVTHLLDLERQRPTADPEIGLSENAHLVALFEGFRHGFEDGVPHGDVDRRVAGQVL